MKGIATDISSFTKLITDNKVYVDKTAQICRLADKSYGYQFFLARPRRFGKSLLVSTLKAIFQGKRELFKGLAIDSMDYDWQEYPVIHLDLGSGDVPDVPTLRRKLQYLLDDSAKENGVALTREGEDERFKELIRRLAEKSVTRQVVLLVDEYDKPLLGHLGKPDVTEIRGVLKSFYSVIKTTGSCQRFALITGVSKFSKVSIFSGLNNLTDLSMDPRTATLLGYTRQELQTYFSEQIRDFARANNLSGQEAVDELEKWYDGYRFTANGESVFNPVSIGKCLSTGVRANYWFETGTPAFLMEMLKHDPVTPGDLVATEEDFSFYEPESPSLLPLLVQTGYLTLKGSEMFGDERVFRLGYPNKEVGRSFSRWVVNSFSGMKAAEQTSLYIRITQALASGDLPEMFDALSLFFAKIPYDITLKNEKYYQSILYAVFSLIGAQIEAEVRTNIGRIDAVLKTAGKILIFEFKLNGSAEEALAQIKEKRYAEKFADDERPVVFVGVAFDPATRNIGEWMVRCS